MTQDSARFSSLNEIADGPLPWHSGSLAAFAVALVSTITLFVTPFWMVAASAVVLAGLALSSLARNPGVYRGRGLAITALWVGLFLLGYGAAFQFYRESLLLTRSDAIARDWLQLISEDRMPEAHQWLLSDEQQATEKQSLSDFYAQGERATDLKNFRQRADVAALRGAKITNMELLNSRLSQSAKNWTQFTHRYRVFVSVNNEERRIDVDVVVERYASHGRKLWRISSLTGTVRKA